MEPGLRLHTTVDPEYVLRYSETISVDDIQREAPTHGEPITAQIILLSLGKKNVRPALGPTGMNNLNVAERVHIYPLDWHTHTEHRAQVTHAHAVIQLRQLE
jgi:hypothetical protein